METLFLPISSQVLLLQVIYLKRTHYVTCIILSTVNARGTKVKGF